MQMHKVETSAGMAICADPSRIAVIVSFPCARFRSMFSIATVASSTKIPTASAEAAERHNIDRFMEGAQHHQRYQNGERNRKGDDHRAPPAPQKEQNHQSG